MEDAKRAGKPGPASRKRMRNASGEENVCPRSKRIKTEERYADGKKREDAFLDSLPAAQRRQLERTMLNVQVKLERV